MSMKLNKVLSSTSAPQASSLGMMGEVAASQTALIIIGFADVQVYGLQGGSWSNIKQIVPNKAIEGMTPTHSGFTTKPGYTFVSLEEYEDVYFVSNTGKEEPIRFFFVEDYVVSPANQAKASKLEDISDMPAFTEADAGKVLSVGDQGQLVWINR